MSRLAERARRLKLRLAAMSDPQRGGDPCAVARALPPGAWLILRHYGHPDRSVLAIELAKICRSRRLTLLIAGDLALALRLGAGVHLPEFQAARPDPRLRLWRRRGGGPLSCAAHGRRALRRAGNLGADAAILSPVFATASHPGARPLGLLGLRRLIRGAAVPVLALGGVAEPSLAALAAAGAAGVAAVSGFSPPSRRRWRVAGAKSGRSAPAAPA